MEEAADIFRIEMSQEEPAQDTLSWKLTADENHGLKAGNPHFPLRMKIILQYMANPLFFGSYVAVELEPSYTAFPKECHLALF